MLLAALVGGKTAASWGEGKLSVNSPALILSKNSGVFLAKIG